MEEKKYIKCLLLLFSIIPLSFVGYYFAVSKESLFFVYEWLLSFVVISSIILAVAGTVRMETTLKWVSASILAFPIQFSVFSLFLGPITEYRLFYLFYAVTFLEAIILILAIRKVDQFRSVPIMFMIISLLFTLYMAFLNSLWGKDLS